MICEDENRPYPRQTTIRTFVCAAILFLNNQIINQSTFYRWYRMRALSRWIFFFLHTWGANLYGLIFSYYGQNKQINSSVIMNGEIRSIKGFHVFFACCNVVQNGIVNYEVLMSRWKKYAKIDLGNNKILIWTIIREDRNCAVTHPVLKLLPLRSSQFQIFKPDKILKIKLLCGTVHD